MKIERGSIYYFELIICLAFSIINYLENVYFVLFEFEMKANGSYRKTLKKRKQMICQFGMLNGLRSTVIVD